MLVGQVVVEAASFVNLLPDAFDSLARIAANVQARVLTWLDRIPFLLADGLGDVDPSGIIGSEIRDRVIADRKSTRLNSSHVKISYAVFCLKKKKKNDMTQNIVMNQA